MRQVDSWRLRMFGGLTLEHNGEDVLALRTRKDDLVLAYLALAPATTHLRTTLVAALWPGKESAKARKILSFNLFSLKKRLEEAGLKAPLVETRSTLRLSPSVSTDAQEFSDLVKQAAALGEDQIEERLPLVNRAIELYGDGLMPSYRYAWIDPYRQRVEELHRQALAMRAGVRHSVAEPTGRAFQGYDRFGAAGEGLAVGPVGAEEAEVAGPTRVRTGGLEELRDLRDQVAELEPLLSSPDRWSVVQEVDDLYESRLREILSQTPRTATIEPLLSIATGLWRYWYLRAHYAEGAIAIDRLLSSGLSVAPRLRAKALHASGTLAHFDGDHERAVSRLQEAMVLWKGVDDDEGLLRTLVNLGLSLYGMEEHERALGLYEQAIAIATRQDNQAFLSTALFNAALAAMRLEDTRRMREYLNRRLAMSPAILDDSGRAGTYVQLAAAALMDDDDAEALELAERAWKLVQNGADHKGQAVVLSLLGRCEQRAGHLDQAIAWYERSLEEAKTSGDVAQRAESVSYLAVAHAAKGDRRVADRLSEQARQLFRLAGAREPQRRFEQDLAATNDKAHGA